MPRPPPPRPPTARSPREAAMASVMDRPVKLKLGCGPSGLDDWLNFDHGAPPLLSRLPMARRWLVKWGVLPADYDVRWPPIRLVDIRRRFPLAADSVQFIYCSHVLGHLERWEAMHVLRECHRVRAARGCVQIVVPDLRLICTAYLAGAGDRPSRDACRLLWGYAKNVAPRHFVERFMRRFIRQWRCCCARRVSRRPAAAIFTTVRRPISTGSRSKAIGRTASTSRRSGGDGSPFRSLVRRGQPTLGRTPRSPQVMD